MRIIAHLSDPHFGTEDPTVLAALIAELDGRTATVPSLVAISGDLTQRAKEEQFLAARAFLDRLPCPSLVVPGNHDVPLYDLASRFLHPFRRYQQGIGEDLTPRYIDDELVVVGVNTAHGFTVKDGKITPEQVAEVASALAEQHGRFKAIVAHHPFVVPRGVPDKDRVDGADTALPALEAAGVELILSGHLHVSYTSDAVGFRSKDRRVVAVHAGTCISTRTRGEANGYNRLVIDGDSLVILHRLWNGREFVDGLSKAYRRVGRWWERSDAADAAAVAR